MLPAVGELVEGPVDGCHHHCFVTFTELLTFRLHSAGTMHHLPTLKTCILRHSVQLLWRLTSVSAHPTLSFYLLQWRCRGL